VDGGFQAAGEVAQPVVRVANVSAGPGDLVWQPGEVVGKPIGGRLVSFRLGRYFSLALRTFELAKVPISRVGGEAWLQARWSNSGQTPAGAERI